MCSQHVVVYKAHGHQLFVAIMTITADTWAIVSATGLGPVLAVALTLWREAAKAKNSRRLHVFRTLMATRRIHISNDHVSAINLVEVDFYKCRNVEAAWKEYRNHLIDNGKLEDQYWREKKENLLAKFLCEIGVVLGFKIPAIDIFRGGYAPKGWEHRDNRATNAVEYIYELSQGKRSVPMAATSFPVSQDAVDKQNSVQDALFKTLSGERPLKIKSEGGVDA